MEYRESLLQNYTHLIELFNDKSVVQEDDRNKWTTVFPCEPILSSKGNQFFLVACERTVSKQAEDETLELTCLLYQPGDGFNGFLYGPLFDYRPGELLVVSLSKGRIKEDILSNAYLYNFYQYAEEYHEIYGITPIFMSLLSHEQALSIRKKKDNEWMSLL